MKNNKKQFNAHTENEPRISVRPGNFIVPGGAQSPATKGAQTGEPRAKQPQKQESGAARAQEGNAGARHQHHKHKRRGDARHERDQAPKGQQTARGQSPAPEKPAAREMQKNDKRHRGDRRHGDRKDAREAASRRAEAPVISKSLQKELDEQFSLVSSLSSTMGEAKKKPEPVIDTKEFEVDIATAAYLIEDIPTGFPAPDGKSVEVVGVRFRQAGKVYFFEPAGLRFKIGEAAIVDTARGAEFGEIVMLNRKMAERDIVQPLRSVLRRASEEDIAHNKSNREKEKEALTLCAEKIAAHKLDMKLVDAQYTFDNSKLLFYFTSEGRVDFRELVRDLAGVFRTRIELRQIGIRDEARLIGGLGLCGRPFCCTTFLSDFGQVSVKMAKEQGLAINTSKTSGCCGRLICCLRYEQESYAAEAALTPSKHTRVRTPDGVGTVVDTTPIAGTVKVKLDDAEEGTAPKVYHRDTVEIIAPPTNHKPTVS